MTLSPTICRDPGQLFCIWSSVTAVDVISWTLGGVHLMTRADRCLRKIATACQRQCSSPATFRGATIVGEQEAGAGEQSLTFWLDSRHVCWVDSPEASHSLKLSWISDTDICRKLKDTGQAL